MTMRLIWSVEELAYAFRLTRGGKYMETRRAAATGMREYFQP
ncbi:hypothetical protein BIWAKO_02846 [Bosea sp. BIWAKO-01]|nr:hypothetical protein BIWAKO_02846 [Bosea sp. BIWAKO-01]